MAKKPKPEGKKYNYMDTYGDLVTLLMCFFVLLFAMSTVEENKFNAFAQALTEQFAPTTVSPSPPPTAPGATSTIPGQDGKDSSETTQGNVMSPEQNLPQDFTQISQAIEKYIEENKLEGQVQVEVSASGATFIRLSDNLLFAGNSAELRQEATEFLDFLGQCFLEVEDQIFRANFIGHTAEITGSEVDDWVLSSQRSGRVASYFERTVGLSKGKMETTGYGRTYPIADNQTAEGRAKNRRVDIVVVSNNTDNILLALADAARVYFPGDSTEFYQGDPNDLPENTINNLPPVANLSGLSDKQVEELTDAVDEAKQENAQQ